MSHPGLQPSYNSVIYEPLSADPSNPTDGQIFYSDGTPRDEGLWVWTMGAWSQVSVGSTLSVLDNLTLTPQSSDPGTPATGMLFYSDGTPRAAGLWVYNGTAWVQLTGERSQTFTHKTVFTVRAAGTANVTLASQVENGDSFGGVTLVTGDLVLVKNQTTSSENGVYIVAASGAPTRHTTFDSASELTGAQIFVSSGTNAGLIFWQTETLTSLSDPQSWGVSPPTFTFTVPTGVTQVRFVATGGGGGGGGTAGTFSTSQRPGGGGGAGSTPINGTLSVTSGSSLTIGIGRGGIGGAGSSSNTIGSAGGSGENTTISGTGVSILVAGASGGSPGDIGGTSPGAGGSTYTVSPFAAISAGIGGTGGNIANAGSSGGRNYYTITASSGGATGQGGGGGGGGPGMGAGGTGGAAGTSSGLQGTDGITATNYGSGGGGGGGNGINSGTGRRGGFGANGVVIIYW